jgi:Tfp pilus assembly protein PilF
VEQFKYIVIALFLVALNGCSSRTHAPISAVSPYSFPQVNDLIFDTSNVSLPNDNELFELTEAQKEDFLTFYSQELANGVKPNKALYNYISRRLSGFSYYGETLIAKQAMLENKGNCLTLAILTTALANLVDLEIAYRKVKTLPVYERKKNIILSSSHVQTVVYDPTYKVNKNIVTIQRPAIIIDYFPSSSNLLNSGVVKNSLIAKYYSNIGSKFLYNGNLDSAFAYATRAFNIDNSSSEIINLLAVLHRRRGDDFTAEELYLHAMKNEPNNIMLLTNYIVLLKSQQRFQELSIIELKVDSIDDPNPYILLEQAYTAQQNNKLRQAEKYFSKTISVAPYLHDAYLGLYKVYLGQERYSKASKVLRSVLPWTYDNKDKQRYNAKLYSLAKMQK